MHSLTSSLHFLWAACVDHSWPIFGLFAGVAAFLFCMRYPERIVKKTSQTAENYKSVNDTRTVVAQLVGGAVVIFTFGYTVAKDTAAVNEARVQTTNEQYLEAAKLLVDNGDGAQRSAAIFVLGRIAEIRPEMSYPVREVLKIDIDGKAKRTGEGCKNPGNHDGSFEALEPEAQAALDVLGHRKVTADEEGRVLYLSDLNLSRANFHMLHSFARPSGEAVGSSFEHSILYGADFRGADMTGARFNGICASDSQTVADWDIHSPDNMSTWMVSERWNHIANFVDATLVDAQFGFAQLGGALFCKADLDHATFLGADLSRADFRGAKNISSAKFNPTPEDNSQTAACADDYVLFDEGFNPGLKSCNKAKGSPPINTSQYAPCESMPLVQGKKGI